MSIKTVEIVRKNWEVTYFYHKNEASIPGKSLFSSKHGSWAPPCEMKSVLILLKRIGFKSSKYFEFEVPGRLLSIVFLSNENFFLRLKLFFIHPNEKICLHVKTEVGRQLVVNSACYKFLALLFTMISWS